MDFPENEQWRSRLLTEAEIAAALQNLSTEAAIELFQHQMLLRSQGHPEPTEPQTAAPSQPEPVAQDAPVIVEEASTPSAAVEEPSQSTPTFNPLFQTSDLAEVLNQRFTASIPVPEEPQEQAIDDDPEPEVVSEAWPGLASTNLVDSQEVAPVVASASEPQLPEAPAVSQSETEVDEDALPAIGGTSPNAWWLLEEPDASTVVVPVEDQITDIVDPITAETQLQSEPEPMPAPAPAPAPEYRTYSTEEIATAVNTPPLVSPAVHPVVQPQIPDELPADLLGATAEVEPSAQSEPVQPAPAPEVTAPALDPAAQANDFIQKLSAESKPSTGAGAKTPEQIASELNARFGPNKSGPDTGFLAAQIVHVAGLEPDPDSAELAAVVEPQVAAEAPAPTVEPADLVVEDDAAPVTPSFGYISQPIAPAFTPVTGSQPVVAPEVADNAAEQDVVEFEEDHAVVAQPNLVDETILAVGGEEDAPIAGFGHTMELNVPVSESGSRPAVSLLATWNGTGALVAISAVGYLAGSMKLGLLSVLLGGFVALVLSGLGFGLSALAARRGRQPQQVLARASFGVRGAIIPAAFLVIARLVATAVVAVLAGLAIPSFFPNLKPTFDFSAGSVIYRIEVILPMLVLLLVLGGLTSLFRGTPKIVTNVIIAVISVAGSVALAAYWLVSSTGIASAMQLNLVQALGLGASIVSVVGLLWGTSAADESPDLKSSTVVPKLIAVGLLNWTLVGGTVLVGGFALSALNLPVQASAAVGVVYLILAVFAVGNLVLRNAASFTGLGLPLMRGWFSVLSLLLVAGFATFIYLRLGADGLFLNVVGYLPAVGVPVVAWLGVLGADTALRRTDFHEVSLLRSYGFYGSFNWATLSGWVVATAAGWGMISSNLVEFQWMGYLAKPMGITVQALEANLGIWIALAIGLITPFIVSIPRIRQQEKEVSAIEARRSELLNVLGLME